MAQHHFINWPNAVKIARQRLQAIKHIDNREVPAIVIGRQTETGRVDYGLLHHAEFGEFKVTWMQKTLDGQWVTFIDKIAQWNLSRADFEEGRAVVIPVWWNRQTGIVQNRETEVIALPVAA